MEGGGFHSRLSRGGVIVAGSNSGSIVCWTVPTVVTDMMPEPEAEVDWSGSAPQTSPSEVLRVASRASMDSGAGAAGGEFTRT